MEVLTESYKYNPDYHKFADYLGLDKYQRDDFDTAKKVGLIYDWAMSRVGRDDPRAIIDEINSVQRKLGVQSIGNELVLRLYQKARLEDKSSKGLEKERALALERIELKKQEMRKSGLERIKEIENEKTRLAEESLSADKGNLRYVKSYVRGFKEEPKLRVKNIKSEAPEAEVIK